MENIEVGDAPRRAGNNNHTVIVLDRSGSMESLRELAVNSLNEQIQAAKSADGNYQKFITVLPFSTVVDDLLLATAEARLVPDQYFSLRDYQPSGMTAFYDAVGAAIRMMENYDVDGASFLFLLISDGQENASVNFTKDLLKEMIQSKQDKGNWTFTFQGANIRKQDILDLGIPEGNIHASEATWDIESFSGASQMRLMGTQSYYTQMNASYSARDSGENTSLRSESFYSGGDSAE